MVQPHRLTDDFRGETMELVTGCSLFHEAQSAKRQLN
jgi:hypothetical protein